jgi:hypothetical protein
LSDLGDKTEVKGFDALLWNGRMSQTYSYFVDRGVTYWDLWVTDSSRMMTKLWGELVRGLKIVLCVEKDSLFQDFKLAARGLGAQCLISGKGKQSRGATEKMLRDVYDIHRRDPFSRENPLIVLHISDLDMDGEAVIGPTFAEQCRRYTPHVLESRVGIDASAFELDLGESGAVFRDTEVKGSWYEVKTTNNGYIKWAEDKGLFEAECPACGHKWVVQGVGPHLCPWTSGGCGAETSLVIKVDKDIIDQPMGFEVEALRTRQYYRLIVRALLRVVPFGRIAEDLRSECVADSWGAAQEVAKDVYEDNPDYQGILKEFERLESIKRDFESRVENRLYEIAQPHESDWENEEDTPEAEDFEDYLENMDSYDNVWRPFSQDLRTDLLKGWMRDGSDEVQEAMDEMRTETIEW